MINIEPLNSNNILIKPVVESTNNWAHQLIQNGNAKHATVLVAHHQTAGKGQRNKVWLDENGLTLMTSIILTHKQNTLENQFLLNMAVAIAIQKTLINYLANQTVYIKWSNDIYVNNKKIAGVLIENIIRGSLWTHSIIGIGINVNTAIFNKEITNATSILIENNKTEDINLVLINLINQLNLSFQELNKNKERIIQEYNQYLFAKNEEKNYVVNGKIVKGIIKSVNENGLLEIEIEKELKTFSYGEVGFIF